MKKEGILNHLLSAAIARLGHGDCILIGDAGCAFPEREGICCIDLAVSKGLPTVQQVLEAVLDELVLESYSMAEEAQSASPGAVEEIDRIVSHRAAGEYKAVKILRPHAKIKQQWLGGPQMKVFVRTGDFTPYGYVMLIGGVPF